MKILLVFFLIAYANIANSQNGYMYNWLFGNKCWVEFSSGSPVPVNGSAMESFETTVSMSDDDGILMFYTNGGEDPGNMDGKIWNSNHSLMQNGLINNMLGNSSSWQGAISFRKSGNQYYFFALDDFGDTRGLSYTIIDMSLNGGLGARIGGENTVVPNGSGGNELSESMTATTHANGVDHWVVANTLNGNIHVAHVTPTGVASVTTQNIGTGGNTMKFNLQGTKFAQGHQIFDFNKATGIFSNPQNVTSPGIAFFGLAFSKSGRFLYHCSINSMNQGVLTQFDVTATDIPSTAVNLNQGFLSIYPILNLQIGPDFKVYFITSDAMGNVFLGAITKPDTPGLGCNADEFSLQLSEECTPSIGLPLFVESDLNLNENIGLNEVKNQNFSLFPNPAENKISIENYSKGQKILILSSDGKLVRDWPQIDNTINVEQLPRGIYFLKIENSTYKFVKN